MKESTKKVLNIGFIVLTIGILVYIILTTVDPQDMVRTFHNLRWRWIAGCLFCILSYYAIDALGTFLYLRGENYSVSYGASLHVSLIGAYYSSLTPGASGGQPMQVYQMNKNGVPVGIGTSAVSIKLFFTQLGTVAVALCLWLLNQQFFAEQLVGVKFFIILGLVINSAVLPIVVLAALNQKLINKIFLFFLTLGEKIRLVRNREKAEKKLLGILDSFHKSSSGAFSSFSAIAEQGLCGALQMFFYMGIGFCVYKAFGLTGIPWYQILLVSYMVFISASFMPLPGGSGAQEGGFYAYYKGIYPDNIITLALFVWRFFTFYFTLIIGTFVTVFSGGFGKKKKRELVEG
ncbi:MAG: flippase-like domain-containing protein [Clostridiales bacterium]|nr:flippase-like domain-containing protein [Clostridiales bacterium]